MDLYDKKILRLLTQNSRYKINNIAKAIKLSKSSVVKRIEKLEETKIITGYNTMFDMRKLGYFVSHILISLKKINNQEKTKIIEKLKEHKNTTFISEHVGSFDLQIIFHSKDVFQRGQIIQEFLQIIGEKVNNYKLINHLYDYEFNFLFSEIDVEIKLDEKNNSSFSNIINKNKTLYFQNKIKEEEIDKIDKQIMKILANNPKSKLVEIGSQVNLSFEGVKKRIQKLIEKEIILKFTIYPNHMKLGLFNYMCLFKINNLPQQIEKEVDEFMKTSNFILYSARFDGEYNLITYMLAKNPIEFKEYFEKLKEIIGDYIINYDISIVCEVEKFVMLSEYFFEN